MPEAVSRLTPEVCAAIAEEIRAADGNEVFVVGNLDGGGLVAEIFVAARGNESAAPVIQSAVDRAEVLIHNHPSGVLRPSSADLSVASQAASAGLGFYIVDNSVSRVYVVAEPVLTRKKQLLDPSYVSSFLAEDGSLASFSPDYEERPSQIALSAACAAAFNEGKVAMFEAGTGVGKSFAYLLPAVLWSLENQDRVVVSTATIHLQQQLLEKDIPLVQRILGREVRAALVKGRGNYVCRRRLASTVRERDFFDEEQDSLDQIAAWVETTPDGSRSDLPFQPSASLWSRICSESDSCMGMRCPWHTSCFVMQARKNAAAASLLVVNHHLLFADIETRFTGSGYEGTAVLPPFHHIVFDEAHAIESAATSFFSESFSRFRILRQIHTVLPERNTRRRPRLDILESLTTDKAAAAAVRAAAGPVKKALENLEQSALHACGQESVFRLSVKTAGLPEVESVLAAMEELRKRLVQFSSSLRAVFDGIGDEDGNDSAVWESKFAVRRLESAASLLAGFSAWRENPDSVFWVERNVFTQTRGAKGQPKEGAPVFYPKFYRTPLSVAETMKAAVFDPFRTVLCLSATLRIRTNFTFWMHRTGVSLVEPDRLVSGVYPSPFPYGTNVLLALPDGIPLPDEAGFSRAVEDFVPKLLESTSGSALVLFTSYEALRSCCQTARSALAGTGIRVLRQGEDDRARLLDAFRGDASSVLFATDSFWEGVDIPGETLRHVILVKFPFRVPNNPVFEARCERIEENGGNPFMELSLPDAVIKFRQGFGRLMRRKTDRGVVTVLDRRITARRYGQVFLESIPETRRVKGPPGEILRAIEDFLFG